MKKVIYGIIALLALFSILRAQADEQEPNRITVHPSLVEFADEEADISIGFGLLEGSGERRQVWNVFPLKVTLHSGENRFYLATNVLSFITLSGVHFGGEKTIERTHRGDVISVGGHVTVAGRVEGSVWVFGADVVMKQGSEVTRDVVVLGGTIEQESGSRIQGNKHSVPQMSIPFLGFLTSPQSAETLLFIIELFGVLLFLLILFLLIHFRPQGLARMSGMVLDQWKGSLLYLFLGVLVVPLLTLLLVASVAGLILVPVLFVLLVALTYFGFVGASVRLGRLVLRGGAETAVQIYLSGILGFFLIRAPSLLGRLLALLTSEALSAIGGFLKVVGSILFFVVLVYSFGSGLVYARESGRRD